MNDAVATLVKSNWFWMLVILLGSSTATAVFSNLFQARRHKATRVFNEVLAGHQFGYVPYYVALLSLANVVAVENWLKGLIGLGIILAVIFLGSGFYLASERRITEWLRKQHGCPADVTAKCDWNVGLKGVMKVARWNVGFFIVSFGLGAVCAVLVERLESSIDLRLNRGRPVLLAHEDQGFFVVSKSNPNFYLGNVSIEDLRKANFFNAIDREVHDFFVTDRLPADRKDVDLDPLPLKLSTGRYRNDYSRYVLADDKGVMLHRGAIKRRGADIVRVNGTYYIVAVVEVNHVPGAKEGAYAKFAIGQLVAYRRP